MFGAYPCDPISMRHAHRLFCAVLGAVLESGASRSVDYESRRESSHVSGVSDARHLNGRVMFSC